MRNVLTDDRRCLQQPLVVRRQAVDACREYRLRRRWEPQRADGAGHRVPPAHSGERLRLDHGLDALLQEERVALRPLDKQTLQLAEASVVTQKRIQQLGRASLREGVEPELLVAGSAAPGVGVLGPVGDEQEHGSGRQAFDEQIEQRLGLRVNPVHIFEYQEQRLDLALSQKKALEAVERESASLRRVEPRPLGIVSEHVQQGEKHGEGRFQRAIQKLASDLLTYSPQLVARLDLEVRAQ